VVLRSVFWVEFYRRSGLGLAAVSLRWLAVPAGRGLGMEPDKFLWRRRGPLEAGDGGVDALVGRGGDRAIASPGRKRPDAVEPFVGTVRGDNARGFRTSFRVIGRAVEGRKKTGTRPDRESADGGDCAGARVAYHGRRWGKRISCGDRRARVHDCL